VVGRTSTRPRTLIRSGPKIAVRSLDRSHWQSRNELALAIFEYIEAFYNPACRDSYVGQLSPLEFAYRHSAVSDAA
jgi:putative transposase